MAISPIVTGIMEISGIPLDVRKGQHIVAKVTTVGASYYATADTLDDAWDILYELHVQKIPALIVTVESVFDCNGNECTAGNSCVCENTDNPEDADNDDDIEDDSYAEQQALAGFAMDDDLFNESAGDMFGSDGWD